MKQGLGLTRSKQITYLNALNIKRHVRNLIWANHLLFVLQEARWCGRWVEKGLCINNQTSQTAGACSCFSSSVQFLFQSVVFRYIVSFQSCLFASILITWKHNLYHFAQTKRDYWGKTQVFKSQNICQRETWVLRSHTNDKIFATSWPHRQNFIRFPI